MLLNFEAKVIKSFENNENYWVVFDKTAFYPRGGGQECDKGYLINENNEKIKVLEVIKKNNIVLHKIEKPLKEGEVVKGFIDKKRRLILTKQHDGVHLLNGVAQEVLGKHVWQAGSFVGENKAHLDLTHYKKLSEKEIEKIEELMNYYVFQSIPINKYILERNEAEKRFGFRLYQGGAIPGNFLRVVEIENVDVEACGGTHGDNTLEIGNIFLTKVSKIQDNIYRFELVSSLNAFVFYKKLKNLLDKSAKALKVSIEDVPKASKKFFESWKELKKEKESLEQYILENSEELIENSEKEVIELPLEEKFLFQLAKKTDKILENNNLFIAKANKKNEDLLKKIAKDLNKNEKEVRIIKDLLILKK